MTDHPITPPPEVVKQWITKYGNSEDPHWQTYEQDIATQAANWGADMELEACCEWMANHFHGMRDWTAELRAARRPKPKSLAEEALEAQQRMWNGAPDTGDWDLVRHALERLQQLETTN